MLNWRRAIKDVAARVGIRFPHHARPLADDWSVAVPFEYQPPPAHPRQAAIVHLFHPEMASEFADLLRNLGPDTDLLISTDTEDKKRAIAPAFADWPAGTMDIQVVENRGRDIAPKLVTFGGRYAAYDLLLFLHSKRTDFSENGRGWREKLFGSLAGSPEVVRSVQEMFAAAPSLGIVFPQHHEPIRQFVHWGENFEATRRLGERMGVALRPFGALDFVSGSMFWARPRALDGILSLGLNLSDFPDEAGQIDGTIAHAVERLFLFSCEAAGLSWAKVAAPEFYADRRTIARIGSREELLRFLATRLVIMTAPAGGALRHRLRMGKSPGPSRPSWP